MHTINSAVAPEEARIRQEQIRLAYQQGPVTVFGAATVGIVMAAFLQHHVAKQPLLIWIVLMFITALFRMLIFYLYRKRRTDVSEQRNWGLIFWAGTLGTGVIWGILPLLFYDLFPAEYLLMITTVFAGMVAVNSAAGSVYIATFYAFSLPVLIPLTWLHLQSGQEVLRVTGVLLIVFFLINVLLSRRGSRHQRELIIARFRNAELLDKLSREKTIAESAVVSRERFIATASHDLRQPIHALGLLVGLLRRRETDDEKKSIVDDMAASIQSLGQLLHSLLDISRLDAGIVKAELTSFPAQNTLQTLITEFSTLAERKNLVLDCTCSDHTLYTDPVLFERIVRNLLSNAIRYTDAGKVSLGLCDQANGQIAVTVRDTGVGIPVSQINTIFNEYTQLNRESAASIHGLGLGLSIVRRLCEILDIEIEVASEPGKGTTFTLLIPQGQAPVQASESVVDDHALQGKVVLLVEDEPMVLEAMSALLRDWGCTVMPARNAPEALTALALAEQSAELIICDYTLAGGENGLDLAIALQEGSEPRVPALMISGDTSAQRLREVNDSGLQLLHKPVDATELYLVMSRMLAPVEVPVQSFIPETVVEHFILPG